MFKLQNYQRHLTSKSYDHDDFGRLGVDEDGLQLEQVRDAADEVATFEQSLLGKRMGRKRKAQPEEEVSAKMVCRLYSIYYFYRRFYSVLNFINDCFTA